MPVEESGEHAAKKISLKYEGRCIKCGRPIPAGEIAYWEKDRGVWHLECEKPKIEHAPPGNSSKCARCGTELPPRGWWWYDGNRLCQRCAEDTRRDMLGPFEGKNRMKKSRIEHFPARNFYAVLSAIAILAFVLGGFVLGPALTPPPAPTTVTVTDTVTEMVTETVTATPPSSPIITEPTKPKWLNPSDPNVINWADAGKYIGKTKTVEGTIVRTYRSSTNTIFLNFHDPYQGYFCGVIFASDLSSFPFKPEDFYRGKEVRISGLIKLYQGSPEIIVENPSQIEVANMGYNYP